ncbi:MAG: type II toxin-antitoxin system VapC family toxin [Burkholderiales bacterium]|nr:type II toxin-antitoxin system VapC family toxin [Burkholderiales bacterium]
MKTAVDSSVLFDIVKGAPGAVAAQAALEAALTQGSACVCAVVVAELGRYFVSEQDLRDFLADCQIDHDPMNMDSALDAARIMRGYARNKGPRERVAPDFLIGAHAAKQTDALLTTDAGFYRQYFEGLTVMTPEAGL